MKEHGGRKAAKRAILSICRTEPEAITKMKKML
jgi:hypothetical protein